ncbi:MAG: PKD domain-containing protein [Thermoplasmata archaeon]
MAHVHSLTFIVSFGLIILLAVPQAVGSSTDLSPRSTVPLNVSFAFTAPGNCNNDSVQVSFHANVSGGSPPYSYSWNLGDGSAVGYGPDPMRTYVHNFAGPYNATLKVTDAMAGTVSHAKQLDFNSPRAPRRATPDRCRPPPSI